jgi:hypothetical protein
LSHGHDGVNKQYPQPGVHRVRTLRAPVRLFSYVPAPPGSPFVENVPQALGPDHPASFGQVKVMERSARHTNPLLTLRVALAYT